MKTMKALRLRAVLLALSCAAIAQGVPIADAARTATGFETATLIDAGKAPRRALQYSLPDAPQALSLEISTTIDLAIGQMRPPLLQSALLRLSLTARPRGPGARRTLVFRVLGVHIEPGTDTAPNVILPLQKELRDLVGLEVPAPLTPHGLGREPKIRLPADPPPQLTTTASQVAQALRDLFIPLPLAPVGAGALWEHRTFRMSAGIRVEQRWQYTMTELFDSALRVEIKLAETAQEQALLLPGMPGGTDATLRNWQGLGSGAGTVTLKKLASTVSIRQSAFAEGGAQTGSDTPVTIRLAISSIHRLSRQTRPRPRRPADAVREIA